MTMIPATSHDKQRPRLTRRYAGRLRSVSLLLLVAIASCTAREPENTVTVLELRTTGSRTAFMPDSISAPAGSTVILRLINDGEIPHNVVVVLDKEAVQPIVLAAYKAIKTEYVPEGFEEQILAATPLVYSGQTAEISFVMPEPGAYTFVCVFPTHGKMMRGTLVSL